MKITINYFYFRSDPHSISIHYRHSSHKNNRPSPVSSTDIKEFFFNSCCHSHILQDISHTEMEQINKK